MNLIFCLFSGIIFTEFVGYWLHILLHSEKMPKLSRAHMLHHLRDYGIGKPMHRDRYRSSADTRTNVLGIGLEWLVPTVIIVLFTILVLSLLQVSVLYQLIFILTSMLWGYFLFGYMHGSMHLNNFWMKKVPLLKTWYLRIQKLHDYHHLQISDDGRMQKNYGICFFWFDRIFKTYAPGFKNFNPAGYNEALNRYRNVITNLHKS